MQASLTAPSFLAMARRDKLLERFRQQPADFSWDELVRLLRSFGYVLETKGKTSGSRARFVRPSYPPINLHRPHPRTIVRRYQLRQVCAFLIAEGLLEP
ncbi:MAG: type II toxin-antitoxin system HicA family toxin [Geminicoccaceae bacterium]